MARAAGCVFCQILEPPLGIVDGLSVLRPDSAGVGFRDLTPVVQNEIAVFVWVSIVREVGDAVQVGDSPFLPFGHPVEANHTGTLESHREGTPEFVPVVRSGGAILQGESECNTDTGQAGKLYRL